MGGYLGEIWKVTFVKFFFLSISLLNWFLFGSLFFRFFLFFFFRFSSLFLRWFT